MEPQEHRERQDRAGEGAAARGLEALVAISRGGHDRVADALWLAGLATSQPFVPDLPRHWRAAGHVAVVLRAHGRRRHLMGGFWGHGLGLGFEPPWIGPESTDIVEPGWCLAVERRAAVPGLGGGQYEDDVLLGPGGAAVLQTSC